MAYRIRQDGIRVSLGFVLAISLAGLQFVAILFVVLTSYVSSERAILDHARGLMERAGANAVDHTKRFLEPAAEMTEQARRVLNTGLVGTTDKDTMERYFFELLQTETNVAGINYGDEQGNFVYVMKSDGPGPYRTKFITIEDGVRTTDFIWRTADYEVVARDSDPLDPYDARTRPWYLKASNLDRRIWTNPYIFFTSQQPGITVAAPIVFEDDGLQGVVGVDIEISDISDFLSDLQVSESGAAVILHQDGSVLAHPDPNQIKVLNDDGTLSFANIKDIDDPVSRAAFANFEGGTVTNFDLPSNAAFRRNNYLGLFEPLEGIDLPWTVAIYAPENDFIGEIKKNRARNIWIAAGISILTALVGLAIAEIILRPVRAFAVRTSLVSQGEVSANAPLPKTYRELSKANKTLIDEIAQRRDSEAKVQELSRDLAHFSRINVMGQMASGLAHELSQPLTAITQNVDAAISTAKESGTASEDLLTILNELDEQAHQGGDVVRALRGFVRKDEGKTAVFNFNELIDQAKRLMRHEAEENHVKLIYVPAKHPMVKGNRVQIAQVLINLIRNAIEAMAAADTKTREVLVEAKAQEDVLLVKVKDTGPGVPEDVRLFKQFQTSKKGGMGLGLSISRSIVENNGGRLWHDAEAAGQTIFCFTLPRETR
ncbi:sensor protein FixL [Actibacterium atlanticum]|uniref:histidine kinase n=2 Tax=Actibacterium atlanticum TaxID=1461693 RepID=A0A058ZJF7_9RHOB|nr:sensor protein FixL [Actibacterium atlanticum]